jgi:hypothetical protein
MAPEPVSTAYFINPSHHSVYMCIPHIVHRQQQLGKVYPFIARQRLGKHIPATTEELFGRVCLFVFPHRC